MRGWRIKWGENGDREIATLAELESMLDELGQAEESALVEVMSPSGNSLAIAVGGGENESMLNYIPADRNPPYLSSVGNEKAAGTFEFSFAGEWSESPRRHLIPSAVARNAVRHFFLTGELSSDVHWEED
jgi:Immunity protein Imm1